ncbi:MAG: DUF1311 domain-containing protein [Saprospiraceae bacterium]|nr:DUF1311 domain-containing protein [Saprospiraceae bacterium]
MRNTCTLILVLFLGLSANAQEIQIDNSRNSCSDYLKLKKEVDGVITKILDDYEKDYTFIAKFKKAQGEWESYRDAQLEMIFPAANKGIYGASYPTCRCNALVDLTNERLNYLVRWVSNTEEAKACGGSVNSTKRKSYVKFNE